MDDLLTQFQSDQMQNPNYTVLVRNYMLGQFRIQLTDVRRTDPRAPKGHGQIVQEMCTYRSSTCATTVASLRNSEDPLKLARSWAKPYNCETKGGRIRLDNRPEDRPEMS